MCVCVGGVACVHRGWMVVIVCVERRLVVVVVVVLGGYVGYVAYVYAMACTHNAQSTTHLLQTSNSALCTHHNPTLSTQHTYAYLRRRESAPCI